MESVLEQHPPSWTDQANPDNQRDFAVQSIISVAFGVTAILAFCALRPRWTSLYAARKRQKNAAAILPELPDTFFGWIPTLYTITEQQVLASAGLDAYVFLSFFRMAVKFTAITFFLQLVIMFPVHYTHTGGVGLPDPGAAQNSTTNNTESEYAYAYHPYTFLQSYHSTGKNGSVENEGEIPPSETMLWLYLMFVYLFTGIALYLIINETKKIIRVRQAYLGSQSTITDRTIRLSGIPEELRTEDMIKETIENLQIGKVESVLLCKDWRELDDLLTKRQKVLRKLEEAWTVHLGQPSSKRRALAQVSGAGEDRDESDYEERSHLLSGASSAPNGVVAGTHERPKTRIWHGFLGLQTRLIDAIDYYEENLRKLDESVKHTRNKVFKPTPLAFVTMDSTAAAQMCVQATMDPEPMKLLAKLAPAPSDVIWQNTYLSRSSRMARAWTITIIIAVLTVFWSLILIPVAGLLTLENIGRLSPSLEAALRANQTTRALFQSTLTTLVFSLLSVAVPYLYYWLSTLQGMTSQGEVEMSLISKNFFFTFFNLFVVFTVFGAVLNLRGYLERINETLKDTSKIADLLAKSLKNLVSFYMNLLILQGVGLFPFRLLEFGSMILYPFYLMGSKTPRDYAEMVEPPVFSYGFYLPQTLLIFIICIVYSTLPASWFILFFGLIYFTLGGFIYKYQLLYAMDHREHSTGKAWPIICNRIVLGLVVFQITMAGILGLSQAWRRAILVIPLLVFSVWFTVFYQRTYAPLMKFIAIRSLNHDPPFGALPEEGESRYERETGGGRNVDEDQETGLRYINPSLIVPLQGAWLAKKRPDNSDESDHPDGQDNV